MTQEDETIVVDLALRLEAPRRERNRAALMLAVVIALAIDLGAVGLAWVERSNAPPPPPAEDIPIEIVVEPPPPPPPSPAPQPEMQNTEELKPAFDAPREGKSDHDDEQVAEKPKPAAAPPPPVATPSPEVSKAAEPPPAPEAPKAAEADTPAPQETPKTEAQEAPAPPAVAALPQTFESVPEIEFGGEAMKSPVTGGKAKSIYTTQLYGLIYSRLHVPGAAHAYGRTLTGVVNFAVDGGGRLTQRYVAVASGSLELDEAVMQAIGAASRHFPKPPRGAPVGMSFTYSVN